MQLIYIIFSNFKKYIYINPPAKHPMKLYFQLHFNYYIAFLHKKSLDSSKPLSLSLSLQSHSQASPLFHGDALVNW